MERLICLAVLPWVAFAPPFRGVGGLSWSGADRIEGEGGCGRYDGESGVGEAEEVDGLGGGGGTAGSGAAGAAGGFARFCLDVDDGGFAAFEGSGVDDHFLGFGELFAMGEDPFLAVDEVHVVAEVAEGDLEEFEFVLGHDGEATGAADAEYGGVATQAVDEHGFHGVASEEDEAAHGGGFVSAVVVKVSRVVESAHGVGLGAEDAGGGYVTAESVATEGGGVAAEYVPVLFEESGDALVGVVEPEEGLSG